MPGDLDVDADPVQVGNHETAAGRMPELIQRTNIGVALVTMPSKARTICLKDSMASSCPTFAWSASMIAFFACASAAD